MQEDIARQEETIEINLIDMFWAVLKQWRVILSVMLIMGILLAGYSAFKEYRHLSDANYVKELQTTYESDLEEYELKKSQLERKIKNLEDDLKLQQRYQENSLMLMIDQFNVYSLTASYYVNTGYEIAPELFYQNPNYTSVITNSYKAAIDRLDLDEVLATPDNPDLTVKNPVNGQKRIMSTSVDANNGVLNITIYGDSEDRVEQIYQVVKDTLTYQEKLLNQVIGEHELGFLSEKRDVDVDTDFGLIQRSFDDKTETITQGIETAKKSLDELKEPVNHTPTKASVVKKGILFGAAGVIIGLILVFGLLFVRLVLKDRIYNVEEIRRRYCVPVLGVYFADQTKKYTKLDVYVAKKLGMFPTKTKEEQIDFIASNIRFYLKQGKKVLLIGNCEPEKLNELKELVSAATSEAEIVVGGNVNDSPAAVNALSEETAVVCVEKWSDTTHRQIRHELDMVTASGNKNLGYIVVG